MKLAQGAFPTWSGLMGLTARFVVQCSGDFERLRKTVTLAKERVFVAVSMNSSFARRFAFTLRRLMGK